MAGFNLGRYWPIVGPQITLFVPGHVLFIRQNPAANVVLFYWILHHTNILKSVMLSLRQSLPSWAITSYRWKSIARLNKLEATKNKDRARSPVKL